MLGLYGSGEYYGVTSDRICYFGANKPVSTKHETFMKHVMLTPSEVCVYKRVICVKQLYRQSKLCIKYAWSEVFVGNKGSL